MTTSFASSLRRPTVRSVVIVAALALLLPGSGSDAQPRDPRRAKSSKARVKKKPPRPAQAAGGDEPEQAAGSDPGAAGNNRLLPGEAEFNECIRIPRRRRIKVTLKPDSTLPQVVRWISSMTCKRFIIGSNLHTQKVTLISPEPVTAQEAYRAFLAALDVMGATVVPSGDYLKVVQGNWAIQSPIPTFRDGDRDELPDTEQSVTQMLRVRHVDVNQLLLVLNKMKSRTGDVTAYKPTNMLIVTDRGVNIRRMLDVVRELDVPTAGEKIWVVQLENADVDEVKKILDQLFARKGAQIPRVARPALRKGAKKAASPAAEEDEGVPTASKIIADGTTNSLIFVASASAFSRIASLLKKLDVESSGSVSQRIHVYYLENGDAEEMAQTLASLTGGAGARPAPRRGRNPRRPQRGAQAQAASLFEGEVKVTADKATNSLVVVASTRDYLNLRAVVRKLDIPRRQVFVEATILEITLNKNRRLGVAYHGGGIAGSGDDQSVIFGGVQHDGLGTLVLDPTALTGLAVGARGALIDGSAELLGLPADIPGFGVMLQALQTNSNVNVLSSPHILTTDNEEAEITVGQNIPFQGAFIGGGFGAAAGAAGGNLGSLIPSVSVQRQDVALKLKLTPHVNESSMVRLELEQEVSDIASRNFEGLGPSTTKRSAKTTIVVRDQQTVVIGGLMGDRTSNEVSKVPLLGDIPILGYLFKRTTKSKVKTNLLIVLTPYIIHDQSDLRRIFEKKLRERREFIDRFTSFQKREIAHDVDYRHKRGLLAEIHRVGARAENEARLLRQAKEFDQEVAPVEMPQGMAPPTEGREEVPAAQPPDKAAKPAKPTSDAPKPTGSD